MRKLLPNKPVFSERELERLSNIFDNAGQVIFGVVVLSPVIAGLDSIKWDVLLLGVMATLFFWGSSFWLAREGKNEN